MLFYLFLFSISCLLLFQGQKSSAKWNIWTILGLFIPSFFAAIRGEYVGTDTPTYLFLYESSNLLTFDEFLISDRISVEPFFYLCSKIGYYLTGFSTTMFIYQGLTVFFLYEAAYKFRNHLNIALVFFLYFTFIFPYSLNITRQTLAMMYLLWLGTYLVRGKKYVFILGSLLGILIHSSIVAGAIIFYWCWFIYKIENNKKRKIYFSLSIIAIGGLILVFQKLTPILQLMEIGEMARYGHYIEDGRSYVGKTDLILRILFLVILFLCANVRIVSNKFFYTITILLGIEMMLIFCGSITKVIFRLALYCTCIDILVVPYLLMSKRFNRNSRLLAQWSMVVIGLVYWWYTMVLRGTNETIPYYIM